MLRSTGNGGPLSIVLLLKKLPDHIQAVIQDSYYVPTPTERDNIQVVLDNAVEDKRKHASDSIANRILPGIEDSLEHLCRSALSAVRRIPREILEDFILAWWLGLDDAERGWSYYCNLTTIMLVCKRWRDTVQPHQQLWSNLSINGQMACQRPERLERLIQAHKQFCPDHPWIVSLTGSSKDYSSHPETLINLLLDTRDRWRSFTLGIANIEHSQMLFAPPCSFPLLSQLSLQTYGLDEDSRIHLTPSDVPVLREVTLSYFCFPLIFLPWSQLTTLVTGAIFEYDLNPLISQLTNVKTLKMDLQRPTATDPSLTYETTHTLHTLCLHFSRHHDLLKIALQRIRIPHLQSLRLTHVEAAVFSGLKTFLSHLPHRSLISLSLTFMLFNFSYMQNLISTLSQLPNLQSLTLSTWMRKETVEGVTALLAQLQRFDDDNAENRELKLCPNLSFLALHNLEFENVILGGTLRVRGDSLKTVELIHCRMLGEEGEGISDEEIRDRLGPFCQDGQWLKISHLARHADTW